MRHLTIALFLVMSLVPARAATYPTFDMLALTDGQHLRRVTFRSYDAASDRFLVIANGKARTIPAKLLPAGLVAELREVVPVSGESVNRTPNSPVAAPTAPAPASPLPQPPANRPDDSARQLHRTAALDKATNFYRYEFQAGSSAIRVKDLTLEPGPTKPVDGWAGRYRTTGKAYLEIFDSKGWSYTRTQSSFEVITEQKPGESVTVIDFSRKG